MRELASLTRAELVREDERADRVVRRFVDDMIAAGRGTETPSTTRTKDDPLSRLYTAALERSSAITAEKRRRQEWHGSLHKTGGV